MRHGQALNTLETTLMSISMTAEVVSLALFVVIRYVSKFKRASMKNLRLFRSRHMKTLFSMLGEDKGDSGRNLDGLEYNVRLQYSY